MAAYAVQNPTFVRLCSTKSVTIGSRTMTNHNKLLHRLGGLHRSENPVHGNRPGRTLVSCVRRNGRVPCKW